MRRLLPPSTARAARARARKHSRRRRRDARDGGADGEGSPATGPPVRVPLTLSPFPGGGVARKSLSFAAAGGSLFLSKGVDCSDCDHARAVADIIHTSLV